MSIQLIVGLQNPGMEYAPTRHNAGGWFAVALAEQYHASFQVEKKFEARYATFSLNQASYKLIIPTTFMNHSGRAVRAVSQFYRISPEQILVVHDDLDLPEGEARLKSGGGHGGHNGLKDIIANLGTNAFHRLRLGIGHPRDRTLVHDYVLGKPSVSGLEHIRSAMERALALMPMLLAGNWAHAMNELHKPQQ